MLVVETVAKIRRAYFVQHKPIKQICRELMLSRKVVRKVIRSEATASATPAASSLHPSSGPGATSSTGCWQPIRGSRRGSG